MNQTNPNLNLSGLLPVNPATAVPIGGNLVNLPTSLLPTLAGATPAGGLLLGIIGSNFNINLAIQALEVQGKARTLAEPKTVTVENAKATISRGFEVPFVSTPSQGLSQVQFKEALLKLEVTPRVIRDNGDTRIRMKVVFENNEPDFSGQRSVAGNPSIFKRRQETEVLVSQGQRLVVGGVTNDTSAMTTREVPVFGRIPVLGWLFKSRETSKTGGGADRHPDADRARRGRGRAEVAVYEAFWHLEQAPFVVTPDVRFLLRARSHHESLSALLTGIARETGVMVLVGDVGTGKSLLCRALCAELPSDVRSVLVINPYLSGAELIGTILDDLGVARAGSTHGVLMAALARHLQALGAEGRSVVVIVDEAQQMSVEALEQIRILSTIDMPGKKLLQVLLVGHPELLDKLGRRELYQLDQRVGVRCRLEPLSARDTSRYVEHRLRVAGLVGALPFTRRRARGAVPRDAGHPAGHQSRQRPGARAGVLRASGGGDAGPREGRRPGRRAQDPPPARGLCARDGMARSVRARLPAGPFRCAEPARSARPPASPCWPRSESLPIARAAGRPHGSGCPPWPLRR